MQIFCTSDALLGPGFGEDGSILGEAGKAVEATEAVGEAIAFRFEA